mmetsp:Transcript_57812/g.172584  ORF Transcript_57812/g.172584 Transcript_57812/m.172584 type:complete len:726 (+) Transcript_57812:326-2503(+)
MLEVPDSVPAHGAVLDGGLRHGRVRPQRQAAVAVALAGAHDLLTVSERLFVGAPVLGLAARGARSRKRALDLGADGGCVAGLGGSQLAEIDPENGGDVGHVHLRAHAHFFETLAHSGVAACVLYKGLLVFVDGEVYHGILTGLLGVVEHGGEAHLVLRPIAEGDVLGAGGGVVHARHDDLVPGHQLRDGALLGRMMIEVEHPLEAGWSEVLPVPFHLDGNLLPHLMLVMRDAQNIERLVPVGARRRHHEGRIEDVRRLPRRNGLPLEGMDAADQGQVSRVVRAELRGEAHLHAAIVLDPPVQFGVVVVHLYREPPSAALPPSQGNADVGGEGQSLGAHGPQEFHLLASSGHGAALGDDHLVLEVAFGGRVVVAAVQYHVMHVLLREGVDHLRESRDVHLGVVDVLVMLDFVLPLDLLHVEDAADVRIRGVGPPLSRDDVHVGHEDVHGVDDFFAAVIVVVIIARGRGRSRSRSPSLASGREDGAGGVRRRSPHQVGVELTPVVPVEGKVVRRAERPMHPHAPIDDGIIAIVARVRQQRDSPRRAALLALRGEEELDVLAVVQARRDVIGGVSILGDPLLLLLFVRVVLPASADDDLRRALHAAVPGQRQRGPSVRVGRGAKADEGVAVAVRRGVIQKDSGGDGAAVRPDAGGEAGVDRGGIETSGGGERQFGGGREFRRRVEGEGEEKEGGAERLHRAVGRSGGPLAIAIALFFVCLPTIGAVVR